MLIMFKYACTRTHARTHTHVLWPSGLCPGFGTRTNMDFIRARDSVWQWHQHLAPDR